MHDIALTPQILVIADDFTGANDAGVSFACAGLQVDVAFELPWRGRTDVLIVNSDSRAYCPQDAAERVGSLARDCGASRVPLLIKKIDSTLRGNLGAELEALMAATGRTRAIVAPALPKAGRTTEHGQCLIHGVPVTQTEFASDPKTPVIDADIGSLLQAQSELTCRSLSVAECTDQLPAWQASGAEVWVVDACSDDELESLAASLLQQHEPPLIVGSAGICDALATMYAAPASRCLLAVIGSMSEIAQQQIAVAARNPRVETLFIDTDKVLSDAITDYVATAASILRSGKHCLIYTCADRQARHHINEMCLRHGLERSQLGEKISHYLGMLTRQIVQTMTPGALYLSGGDVAIAAARELGASGFRITDRVAQCVPYGHFTGGCWSKPVMTKAGGFGDSTTLSQVLNFIEEKMSE